jgi:hypothetical protein
MTRRTLLRSPWHRGWPLLAAALAFGCGGPTPQPADPSLAREALREALDAWQRGETAESLSRRRPPIVVVDHQWNSGAKLAKFELADGEQPAGADLRFEVVLHLEGAQKKKNAPTRAAYTVGTKPKTTVVREDL